MEEPKPDFSIEVESIEEEPDVEVIPKIVQKNVPLVAKPAEPVAKPAEPVAKPAEPVAKPTEPVAKPTEPMANQIPVVNNMSTTQTPSSAFAETIEIENPQSIFPHIEPYPETSPKQHHFQLKHKTERSDLIQLWRQNGITVELNESGKNNVDVTLTRHDQLVGKIQFLHFDRRDRSIRSKHYVKLYLYQFDDRSIFEKAKQIMRDYFHQIGSRPRHRSIKTRRIHRKKVHLTRKHKNKKIRSLKN